MLRKSEAGPGKHPLEDEGWKQMQVLLDRELPVQRRRRGGIWPLVLGGALLLGTAVWLIGGSLMSQGQGQKPITDIQDEQPAEPADRLPDPLTEAHANEQDVTSVDLAGQDPVRSESADNIESETATSSFSIRARSSSSQRTEQDASGEPALDDRTTTKTELSPVPVSNDRQEHPGQETFGPEGAESVQEREPVDAIPGEVLSTPVKEIQPVETERASANSVPEKPNAELSVFNPLSLRSVLIPPHPYLLTSTIPNSRATTTKIEPEQQKQVDLTFGIGAVVDEKWSVFSLDAGTEVGWKFTQNLRLALGAYYWRVNARRDYFYSVPQGNTFSPDQDQLVLSGNPDDPAFEASMDDPGRVTNNLSLVHEVSTERIHYLRVPLYLQINQQRRWQPHLGLNAVFLIREDKIETEALRNQQAVPNLGDPQKDLVRPFSLAIDLGLSIQCTKHLKMMGSYSHGLQSHLNYEVVAPDFSNLMRFWRLGLTYRL